MRKLLFVGVLIACTFVGTSTSATGAQATSPGCRGSYALTFDDGPTATTPQLLAALKSLHARATFFVVGQHAYENPTTLKAIAAAGHEIGDHTWNHPDLTTLTGTPQLDGENGEIVGTVNYLEKGLGVRSIKLFRPPYGKTNQAVRAVATAHGMTEVLWTVDTTDWDRRPTEQIVAAALTVEAGGIILMHDSPYTHTIDALPAIVSGLRAKGLCPGRIVPSATAIPSSYGVPYYATTKAW
jgi:peptidoglycan/xylan/chitin deacetylase (PgdA/CDA1 family)